MEQRKAVGVGLVGILAAFLVVPAGFCAIEIPSDGGPRQQPSGVGDEPHRRPDQRTHLRQAAGEVASIDFQNGRLTLREIVPGQSATQIQEYRLSPRDTAVTDPLDKQFLKLADIQPGYLVRIEYALVDDRRLARTITLDAVNERRWVVGQITSMDPRTGTLTITQTWPGVTEPVVTHYVVNVQDLRIVDLRGQRFISLADLRVGDIVQIEFGLDERGQRVARLISVEPVRTVSFWASGRIESVDLSAGTLVVSEGIPSWNFTERVVYVIDLNGTRVIDLRGRSFLLLDDLKPGDPVTLRFTESQGKRTVQYVLLEPVR